MYEAMAPTNALVLMGFCMVAIVVAIFVGAGLITRDFVNRGVLAVGPMRKLEEIRIWHGSSRKCSDTECALCGILDCPSDDALHYHHDGCPSCSKDAF